MKAHKQLHPPEPGADDCSAHRQGTWNGSPTIALWYPQMGGYSGKCVVVGGENPPNEADRSDACFDCYVWHDGEFPFHDSDGPPVRLHHCMADQFKLFGDLVSLFLSRR